MNTNVTLKTKVIIFFKILIAQIKKHKDIQIVGAIGIIRMIWRFIVILNPSINAPHAAIATTSFLIYASVSAFLRATTEYDKNLPMITRHGLEWDSVKEEEKTLVDMEDEEILNELLSMSTIQKHIFLNRADTYCRVYCKLGDKVEYLLWGNSVDTHLRYMEEILNSLDEENRPLWITRAVIERYRDAMKGRNVSTDVRQQTLDSLLCSCLGDAFAVNALLSRFESDCKYFLGDGNACESVLWGKNVADHIYYMKGLYNALPKECVPECFTMERIEAYEVSMLDLLRRKKEEEKQMAESMAGAVAADEDGPETELAFRIANRIIIIQECDDGYDYTIMDEDYRELDGGIYDDTSIGIREALSNIVSDLKSTESYVRGTVTAEDELIPLDVSAVRDAVECNNEIACDDSNADYCDEEPWDYEERNYQRLSDDGYNDDSDRGCKDCPPDECTGHCMSCFYRPI